ncbi:MAG: glycosyltransferase family 39 protein [Dehalococcoidia bacterium]|nr:glycosyltransferase family 39 protein [Dehalococcoidia bacterium]
MVEAPKVRVPALARPWPSVRALTLAERRWIEGASLALTVGLALLLNTWRLDDAGNGNTYYAAAVRSMAASWHNFFFASFDPGGFISVDKPPVFLWLGALSVRVFGYSSWAILLPSAVAGAGSVALLWAITRHYFGALAATIAALALAVSPISVAVNRLNLPEPFMILVLIGAAGATLRSLDSKRWWWAWIALAGALVGVAFNIKMLAAWIPGPAFALAVVVGMRGFGRREWVRTGARLAILAAATFAVSASWMLAVDAVPASDRPYVGGSQDNSVQNLIVDYNGLGRVDGNESTRPGGQSPANNRGGFPGNTGPFNRNGGTNAFGGNGAPPAGPANGRGGIIAGTPGPWRMFDDANGPQISWLLPFALLLAPLAFWRWRNSPAGRAAVVLAVGWVLLFGLVFSYAQGIYHSYYTSALMPGIALLAGAGVVATIDLARRDARWMLASLPAAWATAIVQVHQGGRVPDFYNAVPEVAAAVVAVAAIAAGLFALTRRNVFVAPALVVCAAALLATPAAWSSYEARNASMNTTLPQAGPRQGAAGRSFGSEAFDGGVASLASFLEANGDGSARWDLATTSAQQASTLVADYNISVMAIGGFSSNDPTITVDEFADYVADGDVRYVLANEGGANRGGFLPGGQSRGGNVPGGSFSRGGQFPGAPPPGQPASQTQPAAAKGAAVVMQAVRAECSPVSGEAVGQYAGNLYDCAGAADRLHAYN